MDQNVSDPTNVALEAVWATESFASTNLSLGDLEAALEASYPFQVTLSNTISPETGFVDPYFDPGTYLTGIDIRPRYGSLDGGRPTVTDLLPLTRTRSLSNDAKESAKERRRTQNRFAQRAYRQRKEQAIKDQEKEIEILKLQLAKEKKLNQALAKVIDFLKEKVKTMTPAATPTEEAAKQELK